MYYRSDEVTSAEMLARLQSRGDFLKMAGAAGLGAVVGSNLFLREALALGPTGPTDPSFSFSIKANYSAFDVISDNFVAHRDGFDRNRGLYEVLTPAPERTRGRVSLNNGRLRVSGDSPFFTLFQTNKFPHAPYAAVIVDVRAFSRSAGDQNSVYAGLIKDDSNYVVAWYNHATKTAGFDVAVNGTVNRLAETPATLSAPARFAFVLNSKEITALADEGDGTFDGWKPLANYPNGPTEFDGKQYPDPATAPGLSGYVDLRDPNLLAQYKYGFGARGGSEATIVLDSVEAGYWGRAGCRDPHVVTYADGTPYISEDGKLYFTLTNAGLNFFSTGHLGVYTIDLSNYTSPRALQEVGKIFFKREDEDDGTEKVFGDHAGHIVYDGRSAKFLVGASTWGDFTYEGVEIRYTWTSKNVLRGVHVLEAKKLTLPTYLDTDTRGTWDPHFVSIGGQWYVAFVDSPAQGGLDWKHYPALAKGPDLENLELVGAEPVLDQTEGMVIQKVGGEWYLLCSSGRDEGEVGVPPHEGVDPPAYRIYRLRSDGSDVVTYKGVQYKYEGLEFFGELEAPYPTNIPHPMIIPLPDLPEQGDTKWIMLTFNGTDFYGWGPDGKPILDYGTHGNFVVMDGSTWNDYYEFPPR